jgi:hypothetical protein
VASNCRIVGWALWPLAIAALRLLSVASPAGALAACPNDALRTGPSVGLPDCRAYEQVSPAEKGGFDAASRGSFQFPADGAPSGAAVAYMGLGPFPGAAGSGLPHAHLSSRGEAGWSTMDVTPTTPQATPAGGWVLGYDFSEDLSQVVLKVPQQALTPDMPAGNERLYNLFLRHRDGGYSLVNAAPPTTLPPPGCVETCLQLSDASTFAGASSDFSRILFETDDSLMGTEAPVGLFANLYENAGGQLHLVGILPDGTIAVGGAVAGSGGPLLGGVTYSDLVTVAWRAVNHAMSADGTRVLFEAAADGGAPDPAQSGMVELYDRVGGTHTVEVSAPAQGATPVNPAPEAAQFRGASNDGSHVLFTSSAELTTQSNTGTANNGQDLYRYDPATGRLVDLSVDNNLADASTGAGVQGVVASSRDGSYVYFVAKGELLPGQGVDGQPNLYVWHEDPASGATELAFVATLIPFVSNVSPGDGRDWAEIPAESQAYATPDGRHLAFMSRASLTGYDNLDRENGKPDSEVYEYSSETRTLLCVSCDPNGAQPSGNSFIGATPKRLASTPFHQPRVLSDDGTRLFFSSPDALTAGVSSPYDKVFEHEQPGTGSCAAEMSCTFLISSGEASSDDAFVDASRSGGDVFIATLGRLLPGDGDNLVDVYDARVDGGFAVATASEPCTSSCQPPGTISSPPPRMSGSTGPSGNLVAVKLKKTAKVVRPSCRTRALRIKHNAKARRRALRRCPRPKRSAAHRTARRRAR